MAHLFGSIIRRENYWLIFFFYWDYKKKLFNMLNINYNQNDKTRNYNNNNEENDDYLNAKPVKRGYSTF